MKIPNHIALIPDGNRRWARRRGLSPWKGHWAAEKILKNFLKWCLEFKIPQVSIWIGSTENLSKRPKREIEELYKMYYHFLERWEESETILDKYDVKVRFIGDLKQLPPRLVELMGKIMQKTARHQKRMLNILINYGGKFELIEAFKKIAEKTVELGRIEITEKNVEENLLVPSPVDLIVRTGGYSRLSNFMLWQASYAELIVLNKLFPDFAKKDFIYCIKKFSKTKRHFGQ